MRIGNPVRRRRYRNRVLPAYEVLEEEFEILDPAEYQPDESSDIRPEHILNVTGLIEALDTNTGRIRWPTPRERAIGWVAERLDRPKREDLQHLSEQDRKQQLADWLNTVISRNNFSLEPAFSSLDLKPQTRALLLRAKWQPGIKTGEPAGKLDIRDLEREERRRKDVFLANRLLLEALFPDELKAISDIRLQALYDRIQTKNRVALCLSGGGIRSASFALGLVQGLARHGLLEQVDYLSTVSGGGYLGGWLKTWMKHSSRDTVLESLNASTSKLQPEPAPIRHLRTYSNFLNPRLGLFSADTWTIVATYARNLILNWLVLIPLLISVAIVPWVAVSVVASGPADWLTTDGVRLGWLLLIGLVLGVVAIAFVHRYSPARRAASDILDPKPITRQPRASQEYFLRMCLLPLFISAVLLTTFWYWAMESIRTNAGADIPIVIFGATHMMPGSSGWNLAIRFVLFGITIHFLGWAIGALWNRVANNHRQSNPESGSGQKTKNAGSTILGYVIVVATSILAGALTYLAAIALGDFKGWLETDPEVWYTLIAMPVFLIVLLFGHDLYLGFTGNQWLHRAADPEREWGARFNAWVLIVAVGWLVFGGLVLAAPAIINAVWPLVAGLGTASGLATLFLSRSSKSAAADQKQKKSTYMDLALVVVAPVFAASLVVGFSALSLVVIKQGCLALPGACHQVTDRTSILNVAAMARWWMPFGLAIVSFGLSLVMGWLIDTNKFSLHAMYRTRLIRAFLGASRPAGERNPDPFTGFDEDDNRPMLEFGPGTEPRPFHVINMALNLVGGANLAWQQRKAESFTVSGLHAGSVHIGYRRTSDPPEQKEQDFSGLYYGGETGISMGTALTISGAAANPNMGYYSSAAVTFLMTLFNARLGWWLGNPGPAGNRTYDLATPRVAIWNILSELFGLTDDQKAYVHLSDGGHYDNLGLYEMVLRRCRYIIVSDAGCDPGCALQDLGQAIRLTRIDLGVPIEFVGEFNIYPREPEKVHERATYWALARIRYADVDLPAGHSKDEADRRNGWLIYVKPALYGNEPRDIYNYGKASPNFPHESTADQFFSESQFESYRALGSYIMDRMCDPFASDIRKSADQFRTLVESLAAEAVQPAVPAGDGAPAG